MSKFIIADNRYDVILGMLCHVSNGPKVDYEKREVTLGDKVHLKSVAMKKERPSVVMVKKLSVKKLCWMLRACPEQCQISQVFVNDECTWFKNKLFGDRMFYSMFQGCKNLF